MSRPRKNRIEVLCDTFTDLDLATQWSALSLLQELHGQAKRTASKAWTMPEDQAAAKIGTEQKP